MSASLVLKVFRYSICVLSITGAEWGYAQGDGLIPRDWVKNYTKCNGDRQSPINIEEKYIVYDDKTMKPLVRNDKYSNSKGNKFTLSNNGHTAVVSLSFANGDWPTITWNGEEYVVLQFHYHWGHFDQQGSEHQLFGRSFPLEIHIIHWKKDYGNFSEAFKHSDGLLVWGIFYEIGVKNEALEDNVIKYLKDVQYYKHEKSIPGFELSKLLPKDSDGDYYHYRGSLTTPTCDEVVYWIVNSKKQTVSSQQVEAFRNLYTHNATNETLKHILDNYRPVQNLNGRKVYTAMKKPSSAGVKVKPALAAVILVLLANMFY